MNKLLWIVTAAFAIGIIALGYTGSGAWFTDETHNSGYILASGSLDLEVTGGPLRAKNLAPGSGYAILGNVCVRNLGDVRMKYRGQFESTLPLTSNLLSYTSMQVEKKVKGRLVLIKEIPGRAPVETESLPYYFKFPGQDLTIVNLPIVVDVLIPKQRTCYRLSAKLDDDTPNSLQGQTVNFMLRVDATQTNNPTWP